MFSLFVAIVLVMCILMSVYYILGRLGIFDFLEKLEASIKDVFKDKNKDNWTNTLKGVQKRWL